MSTQLSVPSERGIEQAPTHAELVEAVAYLRGASAEYERAGGSSPVVVVPVGYVRIVLSHLATAGADSARLEDSIHRAYIAGYLEADASPDPYERIRARAEGWANHYVNARRNAARSRAHARTDIPDLLAEVRRLQGELAAAREETAQAVRAEREACASDLDEMRDNHVGGAFVLDEATRDALALASDTIRSRSHPPGAEHA